MIELTQESVHTNDNKNIVDIEAMNKNSIVVKRGFRLCHDFTRLSNLHHTNSSITLATDLSIHRFVSKIISTYTLSHNIL